MDLEKNGDGVLGPAVPAALLGAYWLMVDSPARPGCERCRPRQAAGDPSRTASDSCDDDPEQAGLAVGELIVRSVVLAVAAAVIIATVWTAAHGRA